MTWPLSIKSQRRQAMSLSMVALGPGNHGSSCLSPEHRAQPLENPLFTMARPLLRGVLVSNQVLFATPAGDVFSPLDSQRPRH